MDCNKFGTIPAPESKVITKIEYLFYGLLFLSILRDIFLEQIHFKSHLSLFTQIKKIELVHGYNYF